MSAEYPGRPVASEQVPASKPDAEPVVVAAPGRSPALRRAIRVLRILFVVVLIVGLALSLRSQFSGVRAELADLSWPTLLLAVVLAVGGVGASMMGWRALLADLGSPLPLGAAVRVYSISQLGKYVPGSVWPVLAQMEIGKAYAVPRARAATAFLLALLVSVTSAVVTGGLLAFSSPGAGRLFALLPLVAVILHPRVLRPVTGLAARILRRPGVVESPSLRGVLHGVAWMLGQWVLLGLASATLAAGLDAHLSLSRVIGAVALSWAAGLAVVVVPAGAGVRESVLAVLLASQASTSVSVAIALLSRLAITIADGLWALLAIPASRQRVSARRD